MKPYVSQIHGILTSLKNWNKADAVRRLIPVKVEDGKMMTLTGNVIATCGDCPDAELIDPESIRDLTRVTASMLEKIETAVLDYINSLEEQEEQEEPEIPEAGDVFPNTGLIEELDALLEAGKVKKVKKLLKKHKEELPKEVVKEYKTKLKGE